MFGQPPLLCLRTAHPGTIGPDGVATAREKQDAAFAVYRQAKDHEHGLADERGQVDRGVPLVVGSEDAELQGAVEADSAAQQALSEALRAGDD